MNKTIAILLVILSLALSGAALAEGEPVSVTSPGEEYTGASEAAPVAFTPQPAATPVPAGAALSSQTVTIRRQGDVNVRRQPRYDSDKVGVAKAGRTYALLDIAYADKLAQGDALYLYQQATARYAGDDYWPFLVVELANIYKDCAAYDAAINTYEKALQQPMIAGNTVMAAKFQETLDYLRRVQHILAKHHAEATPFPEIPADWLQAAEQADLHGQA